MKQPQPLLYQHSKILFECGVAPKQKRLTATKQVFNRAICVSRTLMCGRTLTPGQIHLTSGCRLNLKLGLQYCQAWGLCLGYVSVTTPAHFPVTDLT